MVSTPIPAYRVFVDSSVFIASIVSATGSAHDLMQLGAGNQITLIISPLVLSEVQRNLERKIPAKIARFQEMLDSHRFETIEPPADLIARETQEVEPKDAAIVAAAVVSNAQFLVTYDAKHLLTRAASIEARHRLIVCAPAFVIALLASPG